MSDKLDDLYNGIAQVEALGEASTPWSGCLTAIIGLIIAAVLIAWVGGF